MTWPGSSRDYLSINCADGYFFSVKLAEKRVFSQLMLRVHDESFWSKEMVKSSTGAGVLETFMSARRSSSLSHL